jgi:hypothetical protein
MEPPHRLLGEILVDSGQVTLVQLNEARRRQMQERERRIGEILVEMGHLSPDALARALAIQSSEDRGRGGRA